MPPPPPVTPNLFGVRAAVRAASTADAKQVSRYDCGPPPRNTELVRCLPCCPCRPNHRRETSFALRSPRKQMAEQPAANQRGRRNTQTRPGRGRNRAILATTECDAEPVKHLDGSARSMKLFQFGSANWCHLRRNHIEEADGETCHQRHDDGDCPLFRRFHSQLLPSDYVLHDQDMPSE